MRFDSSGCVRVQNLRELVDWLVRDTPGWTRDKIDATIKSGDRIDARLSKPVPVYWVYVTAWAMPDGVVQFRDDIYDRAKRRGERPLFLSFRGAGACPRARNP